MFIVIGILTVLNLGCLCLLIKRGEMNTRVMCIIGAFAAISVVLKMFSIPVPTGGSIALLSVVPAMLLAILYGPYAGIWVGVLSGILAMFLIPGWALVHPLQLFVEHISALGALGYAGLLGNDDKKKIILACIGASCVNVTFHIFSGALFFGMFAPEGMSVWMYTITYNLGCMGVECALSVLLISLLPIQQLKRFTRTVRA
ncbi:MAG: hypothetical protein ATN33_04955 [Epulopiscium sp. Nele67-Bin001]|nr:MAG: hypothetical protein BEN18_07415 [Epulopiscium sp. Nuni2H_MBin001]OON94076.1 MAG: hypothetical protein ATN33_04955 [Epulopiscium sp. Nele67-Bin001]